MFQCAVKSGRWRYLHPFTASAHAMLAPPTFLDNIDAGSESGNVLCSSHCCRRWLGSDAFFKNRIALLHSCRIASCKWYLWCRQCSSCVCVPHFLLTEIASRCLPLIFTTNFNVVKFWCNEVNYRFYRLRYTEVWLYIQDCPRQLGMLFSWKSSRTNQAYREKCICYCAKKAEMGAIAGGGNKNHKRSSCIQINTVQQKTKHLN